MNSILLSFDCCPNDFFLIPMLEKLPIWFAELISGSWALLTSLKKCLIACLCSFLVLPWLRFFYLLHPWNICGLWLKLIEWRPLVLPQLVLPCDLCLPWASLPIGLIILGEHTLLFYPATFLRALKCWSLWRPRWTRSKTVVVSGSSYSDCSRVKQ